MVLKQNPEQTVMRPFSKSYFDYIHYNNYSFWFWVFSITLILANVHNFLFLFTSRLSSCTCGPCGGAGHGHSCCCEIIFCASVGSVITCLIQIRCFTLEMNINWRFEKYFTYSEKHLYLLLFITPAGWVVWVGVCVTYSTNLTTALNSITRVGIIPHADQMANEY